MFSLLVVISLLQTFCTAYKRSALQPSSSLVYQFQLGANIENLVVSEAGELLVTRIDVPELWQIDPANKDASLVATFPGVTGLSGIAEIVSNQYVVVGGNFSSGEGPGSFVIWRVHISEAGAAVSMVADVPQALLLNDIEPLGQAGNLYMISDSGLGVVFRLNIHTGEVVQVIDDQTMKPTAELFVGINGLAVHDAYLYYANSAQETFSKIKIDMATGQATGSAESIVKTIVDDFVFDSFGNILGASNLGNEVKEISPRGQVRVLAGGLNSSEFAGDTSTAFGRTSNDWNVLYVSTSGAGFAPVNGTYVEGGKVVAIELGSKEWQHVQY